MQNLQAKIFIFLSLLFYSIAAPAETIQTVLVNEVVINKPIDEVFNYATTADNWKQWHPNTFDTQGASDHSATEGEEIVELIKVGRIRVGKLFWTVTQHVEPTLWQINGVDQTGAAQFLITYTFSTTEDNATLFRRE
ncbi:MAG TPA: SRPBCC family protein [Dongiaceae bacterium]|nr:SRPBCC family protein [Dongiaceae bacterium]